MDTKKDEVLMNICAETQGCLEIDPDTSEPQENCVYSKLVAAGFSSDILCSADERDAQSINFLHNLVHPEHTANGGAHLDKMHPQCLSLVSVIQKCKLKIATAVSENIVSKEEKDAFSLSYIHRKIGTYERLANEQLPDAHKPNGHIWKRAHGQVQKKIFRMVTMGQVYEYHGIQ